jgi:hypothetical protein
LQNTGQTTWTTDYLLRVSEAAHPLGATLGEPYEINLPYAVAPGETVEISVNLITPETSGRYEFHYFFYNNRGELLSGDGNEIWIMINVGSLPAAGNSVSSSNVTMQLMEIDKQDNQTNVEICAQWPDTQDWNVNGVVLLAGNLQYPLSGYMLKNPKDPATFASAYRCFIFEFTVGRNAYGDTPLSISISNIRVPAENNLEVNCARAKQQLAATYPGLGFTCGTAGFYYTSLKLPSNLSAADADRIIMDALEQAIYGSWLLSE